MPVWLDTERHRTRNAEAGVSITPSGSSLTRVPFAGLAFCGQVNRCHAGLISHESGVQLASPQPIRGSRSTGGPLACNQQMRVQFPPLPPNSPGRPLRSRRQSEKLEKHVRLVPLAPTVTVAERLRRATVDRSTRVRFSPVTPFTGRSSSGRTRVFETRYGSSSLPLPSS